MPDSRPAVPVAPAAPAPGLDPAQRAVVAHPGGPLLVLAGPGTGKTTTLVEAVAARVEAGVRPDEVLVLTFSRKAAEQLRDRITTRLDRTLGPAMCQTFHGFAYGLVRAFSPAELYAAPLRLLSAPEQDVVLRELLTDAPESVAWPPAYARALGTRGFAAEVQAVLARAREKGLDGPALAGLGERCGVPELAAAGEFLEQYLTTLDALAATDYADLIRRAVIEAEAHREELRRRYRCVFVDEYQDTDPGQVRLLQALAGDGRDLVVVGDPHQSIYGFRGADVRGILDFPRAFPTAAGAPAPVRVLGTTRRFGPRLLVAAQRVAARLPLGGALDAESRAAFLAPVAEPAPGQGPGRAEVVTFDSERAEAEHLADLLRRAHLEDGVPWGEMAVLVRSGRASLPALRRSLGAAGVPVEVASDEVPLRDDPAVRPLLDALDVVAHLHVDDPAEPGWVDDQRVSDLLASPVGGLDAVGVRTLSRVLRQRERARATAAGEPPRSSAVLLRAALRDPDALLGSGDDASDDGSDALRALADLLARCRAMVEGGASAEEVLWELWTATGLPERLRAATRRGGGAARRAHRDLDAVCALFETAARVEDQRGHTSIPSFLAALRAQQIPADTLADRGVRGEAVRLMTAHRSKGLEWRLVVVAHVQEDGWPVLRQRATLLGADRIGSDGLQPPLSPRALLAEERRLFYVACTRARERLVVTAVAAPDEDGEQPSRFLDELGVTVVHRRGRPQRPLSLAGLVAELRRTAADPGQPADLRRAAARRLARLAREEVDGRPLVPAADPGSWWGTRAPSLSDRPVRPADEPVVLSASTLTALGECPAKWFLEREAGGVTTSSASQGFGLVVHALAERLARGDVPGVGPGEQRTPEQVADDLMELVDRVWPEIPFRTPWSGSRERREVREALRRFVAWHRRPDARTVVGLEARVRARVELPDGQHVALHGFADRLEVDLDGRVVVVDLKTGKYPPTEKEVAVHPQLGLYQLAVEHGAADHLVGPGARPGGAELVQLRKETRGTVKVQAQPPQEPDDEGVRTVERQLMSASRLLREERFPAIAGPQCDRCAFVALCPVRGAGTVLS